MNLRKISAILCVAFGLSGVGGVSRAALVTLTGTNFDLTYDTTKLGLFGAPTLVADTLFFTPNNFFAESLNGAGADTTNSTVTGLVLTAKNGYKFGAFELAEFGDYLISGAGSLVRVQGQLRAFNVASSLVTQTTNALTVNPLTPLTLNDGLLHDWNANARIDSSTSPVPVPFGTVQNVILSNPEAVGLTIENRLTAYTDPAGSGLREAFIEKKFAGVQLTVTPPSAVPLPAAAWLMLSGIGALGVAARRCKAA